MWQMTIKAGVMSRMEKGDSMTALAAADLALAAIKWCLSRVPADVCCAIRNYFHNDNHDACGKIHLFQFSADKTSTIAINSHLMLSLRSFPTLVDE
ncbi:hypothetical protein [Herminiimonas fonticola]|uniref:hypothetical protein n=1 Tax=Herminiimonas fonticola TaxID=303380 RepID=UPI000DD582E1|nr:hypothetical protein [Herminiimonas fonticola]